MKNSADTDKAARWRALPLRFKLACWFGVTPLYVICAVVPLALPGWWKLLGVVSFVAPFAAHAALEIACVKWYRANGLL